MLMYVVLAHRGPHQAQLWDLIWSTSASTLASRSLGTRPGVSAIPSSCGLRLSKTTTGMNLHQVLLLVIERHVRWKYRRRSSK